MSRVRKSDTASLDFVLGPPGWQFLHHQLTLLEDGWVSTSFPPGSLGTPQDPSILLVLLQKERKTLASRVHEIGLKENLEGRLEAFCCWPLLLDFQSSSMVHLRPCCFWTEHYQLLSGRVQVPLPPPRCLAVPQTSLVLFAGSLLLSTPIQPLHLSNPGVSRSFLWVWGGLWLTSRGMRSGDKLGDIL